jgi:outer membrane receptor protein involved in Fe transport
MKTTQKIITLFLVILTINSYSQQSLEGTIIDNETNEVLTGALVRIKNKTKGTTTNLNGKFQFNNENSIDSLVVSFMGYQTKTVKWKQGMIISITPSTFTMNQVIITSSRDRQERKDAPVAISIITSKILEETKATSIDQVLNKVNGVYMIDLGNEQHSMSMRQPLSYKSLFLYLEDGIPIRTTGVFNHNALIEINMASTQSMEVIKGPASSIYGSEAIGGAVNFITKRPTLLPTGKIQIQGNNLGYKRADFSASNTWKNLGLVASGYYANRSNGPRDHSDFNKLALTLRGDWKINNKTMWTNAVSYIDYKTDMTGGLDSTNFFTQDFTSLQTFTYRSVNALRFRSTLTEYWNDKSKTTLSAFVRNNSIGQSPHYRVKDDFKPWSGRGNPLLAHGEENDNKFQSYGFIAQHKQSFNFLKSNWITGASINFSPNTYKSNYIQIDKTTDGVYSNYTKTDSLLADYKVGILNTSAYTQLEITPIKNTKVVAGLRYDRIDYNYNNNLDSLAYSGAPDEKNHFEHITPKIGVTYDFGKGKGIYGNYSVGFSPPGVSELYRGTKVPYLKPATYSNYEIGGWIGFDKNKGNIEVSIYQLIGTNEIISVLQDDGSSENGNTGKTKHQGIEYTITYSPIKELSLRFSGANSTHVFVEHKEGTDDLSGNLMNSAPNFIANSEITFRSKFLKNARFAIEWQHMGEYYLDTKNTEKYSGFNLFNLRMGYSFKQIDFWFNTINITDELYATNVSKSKWGKSYRIGNPRSFNLGATYNFKGNKKK